jgi:AcrR family transcriptional regulator
MSVIKRKKDPMGVRERLLDAAVKTMREGGASAFTLDEVARTANVSKGGLLHHFPAKEALLETLLDDLLRRFDALALQFYEQDKPDAGRWLRAYVRATFADEPPPLEVVLMLTIMLAEQPKILRRIQEYVDRWNVRFAQDGVSSARAHVVRGAADSYWIDVVLGIMPDGPAERQALMNELLYLITA